MAFLNGIVICDAEAEDGIRNCLCNYLGVGQCENSSVCFLLNSFSWIVIIE